MVRKKTPSSLHEEAAPVRVSNRASTSQFARIRIQKLDKLPELKQCLAKSPIKTKDTELQAAEHEVKVPKTLEEIRVIIGADLFTPPAVVSTSETAVAFKESKPAVDVAKKPEEENPAAEPVAPAVAQPLEPKNKTNRRKGRPPKPKIDNISPIEVTGCMKAKAERVGKRPKKEKVIFDPSELQVRIRKRAVQAGDKQKQQQTQPKAPPKPPPRLPTFDTNKLKTIRQKSPQFCCICSSGQGVLVLACSRCDNPVHYKCLEKQNNTAPVRILGANNWLCHSCCQCSVCQADFAVNTEIFVCVACKQFFHAHCLRPRNKPILDKATWKCYACVAHKDLNLPVRRSRAYTQHQPQPRNIALVLPSRLEQLHQWTVDEVYKYFAPHFPNEAALFRDQEIDGAVLMLMRRSDVLEGFGKRIKVGTAVNLYRHIVMMQTKNNDPRLTWY